MHITISANRTTCIVLAMALGAYAIGYVSQIVRPAFAQGQGQGQGDTFYSPETVTCVLRNVEKVQNVQASNSNTGTAPFYWLVQACIRNPSTR